MTRRSTGIAFLCIAAFLFSMHYITAALYGSGVSLNNEYSAESFERFLSYVGDLPVTLSIVSALLGIGYLAWAELESRKR
jgi:hypothetical protein